MNIRFFLGNTKSVVASDDGKKGAQQDTTLRNRLTSENSTRSCAKCKAGDRIFNIAGAVCV